MRTYEVFETDVTVRDTDRIVSAVLRDLRNRKMNADETMPYFAGVALMLKREDQEIKRDILAVRGETLTKMRRKRRMST